MTRKIKNLKSNLKKNFKMKNDNDMSIEISNDYYHNDYDDYDDVFYKQTNESIDDSDDDAAEIFGY